MCKEILLTNHAKQKITERSISLSLIEGTINNPDFSIADSMDSSVTHMIKKIDSKYLRVLLRKEGKKCFIITMFFDRRLKGVKNDKS